MIEVRTCFTVWPAEDSLVIKKRRQALKPKGIYNLFVAAPWCSIHACITAYFPYSAARKQSALSHGQPFASAHFNIARYPHSAAPTQVSSSHGQPLSRAHFKM